MLSRQPQCSYGQRFHAGCGLCGGVVRAGLMFPALGPGCRICMGPGFAGVNDCVSYNNLWPIAVGNGGCNDHVHCKWHKVILCE